MSGDLQLFPSKSAVRRARSTIRAFQRGDADLPEMFEALTALEHTVPGTVCRW